MQEMAAGSSEGLVSIKKAIIKNDTLAAAKWNYRIGRHRQYTCIQPGRFAAEWVIHMISSFAMKPPGIEDLL